MPVRRSRVSLHDFNRQGDVESLGSETHAVVAGLIAKFAGHHSGANGRVRGDFEARANFEVTREHRQRLFRKRIFFHGGLRENNVGSLQRSGIPCQAQRDQILVRGRVTVDVKTGAKLYRERSFRYGPHLGRDLLWRREIKDVGLGGAKGRSCQEQNREQPAFDRPGV